MATNAFRATLPDDSPIGLCYEPTLALANHSCTPNTFVMFDGRSISLMALNEIQKEEQVLISYVDSTQSRDLRRAELCQRYFFQCQCDKCINNDSPYQTFRKTKVTGSSKLDLFIDRKMLETRASSKTDLIEQLGEETGKLHQSLLEAVPILDRSRVTDSQRERLDLLKLSLSNMTLLQSHQLFALPPYPTILDEIYLIYVSNNYLPAALVLLIFIYLNCDVYNWPQPGHPVLVTRLFTIARLLKYVASLELATLFQDLPYIPQASLQTTDFIDAVHVVLVLVDELGVKSHGKGSNFMEQVAEELKEVEEVQRLRGQSGAAIRAWQSGSEAEGVAIVEKSFNCLRSLAEFAPEVVKKQEV